MADRKDQGAQPADTWQSSRVRRWTDRLQNSRRALWILFAASFAETIIVPIPIELVLIPFLVANRHRLWITAGMVTAGCLLASLVGYGIGFLFFDTIGRDLIDYLGWSAQLEEFRALFDTYGFWAIIAVGVIPIPFQIAMLGAGAAGYPILLFVLAAAIARGIRYFGLAALVYFFGDKAEQFWKQNKLMASLIALLLLLVVFGTTLLL